MENENIYFVPNDENGELHYDVYIDDVFIQTCDDTEVISVLRAYRNGSLKS